MSAWSCCCLFGFFCSCRGRHTRCALVTGVQTWSLPISGPACMRQMRRRLKNHARETAQFRARALLGFVIVVLALGGLAGWYFKLQVLDHADYAKRSEANRIKPRPVVPARGIIYDRKGRILADNVPAFRLDVVPEDAGDPK